MVSIAREPVKRLLGYAVRAEIDSNRIYTRLSKQVKNALLKEKFFVLAREEKKHKKVLETLFANLYRGEKIEVPQAVDAELLPAVRVLPSSSLVDILYQAMKAEKSAQNFYLGLANKVKPPQRRILNYLSQVEKSHYFMLRSEYAMAQQYDDYGERDIDKVIT